MTLKIKKNVIGKEVQVFETIIPHGIGFGKISAQTHVTASAVGDKIRTHTIRSDQRHIDKLVRQEKRIMVLKGGATIVSNSTDHSLFNFF